MRIFPSRAGALAALLVLIGCDQPIDQAIAVVCSEIVRAGSGTAAPADSAGGTIAIAPTDTLALFIVLDSVPPGPGSVRVRVDRLEEPGIVKFFMPPPTAAAAGMALRPPATFTGCAAIAPVGLELRAPWAPRAKAWVRVSSDRPVRVQPRVPDRRAAPVVVMPGTSAIVGWDS